MIFILVSCSSKKEVNSNINNSLTISESNPNNEDSHKDVGDEGEDKGYYEKEDNETEDYNGRSQEDLQNIKYISKVFNKEVSIEVIDSNGDSRPDVENKTLNIISKILKKFEGKYDTTKDSIHEMCLIDDYYNDDISGVDKLACSKIKLDKDIGMSLLFDVKDCFRGDNNQYTYSIKTDINSKESITDVNVLLEDAYLEEIAYLIAGEEYAKKFKEITLEVFSSPESEKKYSNREENDDLLSVSKEIEEDGSFRFIVEIEFTEN